MRETKNRYFTGKQVMILVTLMALSPGCVRTEKTTLHLEEIAGNEEVLDFMKTFDGRGVLSDSSQPSSPAQSLSSFRYPDDLTVALVASEPDITQPVFIDFDHRGRLWVVQYNQYPYPKDLKVIRMDQHIRATFDKVPPPPGRGPQGADRITFFEDTDQDGLFDKSTDAITGLNIATSVVSGRGNIWVLNPPYLLAYSDADDNGIPDDSPVVHLEGFGLEDTHAVANSLRWGPDGWLYGAQGSTCTADISSEVSKNVSFDGQAIWRYHPESKIFEIFAEGGGNTFDIEIDEKGRIYSGDNGTSRGQYYKQGAYYIRNFGKHGALTNPYAFGFLQNMSLSGDAIRFTHAFVKYEGGSLPARYEGSMIAINPLQSFVQFSRFETNGSTFRLVDEARILETTDHWFRPVDITTGPDGAVYIADWYDSRLSHVDPRDTWSKSNGRIYRMASAAAENSTARSDISGLPNQALMALLSHENRWHRQQALRVIGDRRDPSLIPPLLVLMETGSAQVALEALWALNLSGGFHEEAALKSIRHPDPYVRMWGVRLSGDDGKVSARLGREIARMASVEPHPEVRSQLAATAKRLPGADAIPIIRNLLNNHDDSGDPDIPLQLWWALEAKTVTDTQPALDLFRDPALWKRKTVRKTLLQRVIQRYAIAGDSAGYTACAQLIKMAPSIRDVEILMDGLQEGLRGRPLVHLPPVLAEAIKPYEHTLRKQSLALALRQRKPAAVTRALELVADNGAPLSERLACIRSFGEISIPESIPALLRVVESNQSSAALRQTALQSLQRYDDAEIGRRVARAYPDKLRADPGVRLTALTLFASRPVWAKELLNAIDRKKQPGEKFIAHTIRKEDVTGEIVRQLQLLDDPAVNDVVKRLWPSVRFASSSEKTRRISEVANVLQSGRGSAAQGRKTFMNACGTCHRLFGEGGTLGPDLSGYDRKNLSDMLSNIIDPGAYVREGYVSYRVTTVDGRILAGTVADRSGNTVTLKLISGESITLPEGEISAMQAQPSIMPDNLLDELSDEQVRDLFAYLMNEI